jgi:PST family polysaccharide transporter
MPVQSMTNRTLSGLVWMSLSTGANVGALLLVLVVLARLLTPADFGLANVAIIVIGFSAIFSEFGIGPAVVQRPGLQTAHLGAGWTLSVILGVLLGALLWITAPLVAAFFQLEPLTAMLRVLAWTFPLQGLAVVAQSLLQRELRFRCLAAVEIVTAVLGYGVTGVAMALYGYGAWALVGAHVAQAVLRTVLFVIARPHRIWPLLDRRASADLLYFGSGFTVGRVSNYAAGQGEHVVIGYCLGPVALGVYGRAYQLMAGPAVLFGNVLDRVLFPAMVHLQHQPRRLADAYRRSTALVALVILPVSAMVVALAPDIVEVLLGGGWDAVVLPLQILGIGMLFRTGCKISDSLVRATGAVYRRSWRQTAYAALVVVGAWIGQWWGIEGVAVAILGTLVANFLLMAHLSLVLTGMSWRTFTLAHVPGLALATMVCIPVAVVAIVLHAAEVPALVVLVAATLAAMPAFAAACFAPGIFIGADGQWMIRKLRAFLLPGPADRETVPATPRDGHPLWLLTRKLAAEGVRYCRWKAHLDVTRVLSGQGDLDLLVHRDDTDSFLRVAASFGFRLLVPCFEPPAPCELHLYGPDPDSGVLLHIHVHTALLGERRRRGSASLRLDELVLNHCVPESAVPLLEGMPVVQPAAEVIAVVLCAMQQHARLLGAVRLAGRQGKAQAKIAALLQTVRAEDWRPLLARWLPSIPQPLFAECVAALAQPTSWLRRYRLARRLRVHAGGEAPRRSPVQRVRAAWWRLRHDHGTPRQLPSGGAVIAIIGPDASGKSTLVSAAAQWLGGVFRIETAHLGKPPSAWLTLLPNLLLRLLRVATPSLRVTRADVLTATDDKPRRRGLLYRLRAVILAWDRRALAIRLARRADRGWLVVCDRYPTPTVGAPDSARLLDAADDGCTSRLGAWLARLEIRLYREVPPPDIVIRLNAPLDVAVDRNEVRQKAGKESAEWVTRRHKQFFLPAFPHAQVLELDTNQPRTETVRTLRRLVWAALASPTRHHPSTVPNGRRPGPPRIVEFIGTTGTGKSTLIAAAATALAQQGVRVRDADDLILAHHGLDCIGGAKLRSAVVQLLTIVPFLRYLGSRDGRRLTRLALASIARGTGGMRIGFSLLRNFVKRVGCHVLLESIRRDRCPCDIVLCDEGLVHAAHNLFVHADVAPDRDAIEHFARLVPKPDLLVWVTAPTAQSHVVIRRRGHTRVPDTGDAAVVFAEHAQTTFATLARVEGIAERVCVIDNTAVEDDRLQAAIAARAASLVAQLELRLYGSPPRSLEVPAGDVLPFVAARNGARLTHRAVRHRETGMVRTS